MVSSVDEFRAHGLRELSIGAIQWYQRAISARTPAVCRYRPTCSQYGIEAISEWGVLQGILLTARRIRSCVPPNGGDDPVPLKGERAGLMPSIMMSGGNSVPEISREALSNSEFEAADSQGSPHHRPRYDHRFKSIFAYPRNKEFLSREDLRAKIADFKRAVLEVEQFTLLFAVDEVQIGEIGDYYLIRFSGTTNGCHLESQVDEVASLLSAQLEGFFLAVAHDELRAIYFELDGQVLYEASPEEAAVPAGYRPGDNLWVYTDSLDVWDVYWGNFLVDALDAFFDAGASFSLDGDHPATSSDLGDISPIHAADGCELVGCDVNPFDGDGCQLDGCQLDGCEPSGCDLDLDGCGS